MNRLLALHKLVEVTEATLTYADYTPGPGKSAVITWARGMHNEGANLNCSFSVIDSAMAKELHTAVSLATVTYLQLYTVAPVTQPIVLRSDMVLRWYTAGKTVAKIATLTLLVDEYSGET
jgi:hypothetical protein